MCGIRYGNRIVIFAPLYLSNYCVNSCVCCLYYAKNQDIVRKKLTQEEIRTEVIALQDTDCVLISEGCTHHRQCGNIGTVKIPNWIAKCVKANPQYIFTSEQEFPKDLEKYAWLIHCGGCMHDEKQMLYRIRTATNAEIPIVNYEIAIAYMHGILKRSAEIFPKVQHDWIEYKKTAAKLRLLEEEWQSHMIAFYIL